MKSHLKIELLFPKWEQTLSAKICCRYWIATTAIHFVSWTKRCDWMSKRLSECVWVCTCLRALKMKWVNELVFQSTNDPYTRHLNANMYFAVAGFSSTRNRMQNSIYLLYICFSTCFFSTSVNDFCLFTVEKTTNWLFFWVARRRRMRCEFFLPFTW